MINAKVKLKSGEIAVILKVNNGNYLVITNSQVTKWIKSEEVASVVSVV